MASDADIESDERPARSRRMRRRLRVGGAAAAIVVMLLGGLWLARKPIAIHFIAQALRERGVPGRYDVTRIGPRTQRLEHLLIGDPAHPDLTADWVEVDLGYSFSGIRVTSLRTGTVAVNARYRNGRLDLGNLDRLMPKSGGKAALPDIDAEIQSVRVSLATDGGTIAFALDGAGNLRSGFTGALQAGAPALSFGGCTLAGLAGKTSIATDAGEIHLKGPLTASGLTCPANRITLAALRIDADLRTDPALSDINGAFAIAVADARLGERGARKLSGLMTLRGSAEQLQGSASLAGTNASLGFATAGTVKIGGNYALRPNLKDQDYSYAATLTAQDIAPTSQSELGRIEAQAAGTPLAPLAKKLVDALRGAARANSLTVSGRLSGEGRAMQLLVNGADFSAASGAHVATIPDSRFTLVLPEGGWAFEGGLETGGGGLPEASATVVAKPDGTLSGGLTLKDYRAGNARLGLTPVTFSRSASGDLRFNTTVSLDGPIGDGAVRGLSVPVDATMTAKGALRLARDCAPVRWTSLRMSSLSLDPARLDLCGLGGSRMRLANAALHGRIGESPFSLAAQSANLDLQTLRFDLAGLDARIGAGESPVTMQAGGLAGTLGKDGALTGTLADGHATIGAVPFDLGAIAGQWTFKDTTLSLDGTLRVTDRQADRRFNPLDIRAAHLTLVDGRIAASGTLVHPDRKIDVATVTLRHDLSSGVGHADFSLGDLRFGSALQPDDLTPMALGVIVNVDGVVHGDGTVDWSSAGVTASTGTFSTQEMNFAAAFGPVRGFATTLHFTDLLAFRSAPHQRMTVKQVSAGVDVFDGAIDYALLSNEQASIEGGRWPFSGGTLELLPTTLNLDSRQPRRFTFRLVGLDAAAFVNTLQLENVDVHGTLDGLFPMTFDEMGGRIDQGVLVARQAGLPPLVLNSPVDPLPVCDNTRQGGSLAYVGAVSNAQLGTMGKFAFDALKHFEYRCLVIHLDGALDGEFVTQIRFNGINQGSGTKHSWLVRPFLKLPIIFNVRIEAPFRKLLGIYANLNDPTELIRQEVEKQRAAKANSALAVQPADSDNKTEGNVK